MPSRVQAACLLTLGLALFPIGIRLGLAAATHVDHVNDAPLGGDDDGLVLVLDGSAVDAMMP